MKKKQRMRNLAVSVLLIISLFVSACSNGTSTSSQSNSQVGAPNTEETEGAESSNPDDLYFGKYEPAIEVSTARILSSAVKFKDGDTIDNNIWYKEMEEQLGIKLKNEWTVVGEQPGGQGEQKMNVSIASGKLPDIVPLNAAQLRQLAKAGKLADLTEVYEKYASPVTKKILEDAGPAPIASATFDGKLLAMPVVTGTIDGAAMVWVRTDWLKKVGLEGPKTMDDVYKIMDAFVNQDPDGNGKKDTYGMAANKDLYGFFTSLEGFFNGYHAYPRNWIDNGSGNLVFGSIQPEVKAALGKLQELYKKGYIDPEFGVKDWGKEKDLIVNGKIGLFFGTMPAPLVMVDVKQNDPKADWQAFPLVSNDGQPARPQIAGIALSTPQYLAVTKGAEHPEALMKIINLKTEISYGTKYTKADLDRTSGAGTGIEMWMYHPYWVEPPRKNLDNYLALKDALAGKKDSSELTAESQGTLEELKQYLQGTEDAHIWAIGRVFGPEDSSFSVMDKYVNENLLLPNAYTEILTDAMVKRDTTLLKLELETFSKIINGDSLDSFDKFVEDWKKLGGDEMTKEISDWKNSK
jgi:putative aldouronate transport system substrate-binding protein